MIQRIQTIFLFLAFALCGFLLVINPIYAEFDYEIDGVAYQAILLFWSSFGETIIGQEGVLEFKDNWMNFLLLLMSGGLSFAAIFLFRYAKIQIISVLISSVFIVVLGVSMMYKYISFKPNQNMVLNQDLNAHIFWIILILALNALAVLAIQLDRRSTPQNYFGSPRG